KQFVAHNRMMTGGFSVHGDLVTLSDIDCPILAVIGEVDDIGQPASVRAIRRAAPRAEVYEFTIRSGHFGLVVGSKATAQTWPTVARWVLWVSGRGDLPDGISQMSPQPAQHRESDSGVALASRIAHGAGVAGEVALDLARSAAGAVVAANQSVRSLATETVRTLPRLTRLGQLNEHTRISLGKIMSEQARSSPQGDCLLFEGRVHTYEAVDTRIKNVVRGLIEVGVRQGDRVGVLMETRPSALVAIAALSRLGAVAVLMPPDGDLAAAARLGGVAEIITDPTNLKAARRLSLQVLVLGGGETRNLHLVPTDDDVIDMEHIDPDAVELPAWYRPNPGLARDVAFVAFSTVRGELVARQITNYRWALSAFGTASAANLGHGDTVYCLTPLHHPSGLLVSLGGAVVGGSRIALSRGLRPDRFMQEIRQYGVSVVTYTWAMLHEVIEDPGFDPSGHHPVRLFIGSGMPTGLWQRLIEVFEPAHIVEFFATTDGSAVLANVSGAKIGSEGRPLPGVAEVELAAYDADDDLILEDDRGFVRRADTDEVGVLLARPRGPVDPTASVKRGVFAPADTWISTEYLFRRDSDGDYWLVDTRGSVIHTARGAVYTQPVNDAVSRMPAVELAVTYGVEVKGEAGEKGEKNVAHKVAVTAVTLCAGAAFSAADLNEATAALGNDRPDFVHVVRHIELSASYRPMVGPLRAAGIPKAGRNAWYLDPETGRYKRLTAPARADWLHASR
ncbi:MAG: AMP-binding protein, partial [Mycolicibacterium sp.]|nr:AMP-binding protein [Mycolicibacterium sp.]